MTSINIESQTVFEKISETIGKYYNKEKKAAPGYNLGDRSILNTKNLSLYCLNKNLM
jgi:hypothetical protein